MHIINSHSDTKMFNPLKKYRSFLGLLIISILANFAFSLPETPLPVSDVFQLAIKPTQTDSVQAIWTIKPGYYLYKNRVSFEILSPQEAKLGLIRKPNGIDKDDKITGIHEVYEQELSIDIPILNPTNKPLKLLVNYQGCAEWGFCYPPQMKVATISAGHISLSDYNFSKPIQPKPQINNAQDKASNILEDSNSGIALLIFFGFGLLLAFTPCVLPMIPILSGIIVGHEKKLSTKHAFSLSLSYVLGMAVAFAIAGLIVGLLGNSVQAALQTPWVLVLFSLVFVTLALSLFGFYDLKLPTSWNVKISQISHKQKAGNYLGVAVMGALSTLIVSPCVSAPLVGALIYIGNTGNAVFGGLALFAMGLGMGLPLLVIGTSFGKLLPKAGHWMGFIKNFFGVLMLGIAIWMLERIIPGPLSLFLWGCLAVISSVFLGALKTVEKKISTRFFKGVGLVFFVYGILLLTGASMGNSNVFCPLTCTPMAQAKSHHIQFIQIKSITDLDNVLAKSKGKIVMLDFYADWCVACKEMEANTFSNPEVKAALKNIVLLQADVTANDAIDKALEKKYGVIAPPTILFFDKQGQEIKSARIVGEMGPKEFLQHLQSINS